MAGGASAKGLITDFSTSLAFCTRLPLVHSAFGEGADIARASWAFPLVGAGVGAARRAGLLARRRARA